MEPVTARFSVAAPGIASPCVQESTALPALRLLPPCLIS